MRILDLKETDLTGKCGECKSYIPMSSIDFGVKTKYCKGHCEIKGTLVQRTDKKCKKNFEKKEGSINE